MLGDFLTWWSAQLAGLIPAGLANPDAADADAVIIAMTSATTAQLWHRRSHRRTSLGTADLGAAMVPDLIPPRTSRIILQIPPAGLLEREVNLPLAVERDWRNVLRYELGRLTPFAASDVFWTGAVIRRDVARSKVFLRLSLIPRTAIAASLAALRQAGIEPTAIEVAAPGGSVRSIPIGEAAPNRARQVNALRGLAGICAGLALVAIVLPFVIQSRRIGYVDKRIATLRPIVSHVEALRRRVLSGSSSIDVVARERAKVGDPLAVLAAVTRALPDDTYLTELTLRHLKLDLAGQSAAAAPLLAALSANPLFDSVAFSAPVTTDTADHKDIFAIKAKIVATGGLR